MKITKVQLDHFGQWQNQTFSFTDTFQVISGLNGTGKTTLMSFIRGMLFGFPSAKSNENTYENQDAATIYGGRLWFEHEGRSYELSRHQRTNSEVVLIDTVSEQVFGDPDAMLADMMAPITPELYQEIYQFTQDELLEILTLKPKELTERLRVIGIPNAQGWLRQSDAWAKEAEASLGKTPTAKRPINQKIAQLEEAKATLQRMEQGLPEVTVLESKLADLNAEVTGLRTQQTQQVVAEQYAQVENQLTKVEEWLTRQPAKLQESDINDVLYLQNYLVNPPVSNDLERWYDIERLLSQISAGNMSRQTQAPDKTNEPWFYMSIIVLVGFLLGLFIGQTVVITLIALVIAIAVYWQYTEPTRTVERTANLRDLRLMEQITQLGFPVDESTNIMLACQQVSQEIGKLSHQSESYQAMAERLEQLYTTMGVTSESEFQSRRENTAVIVQQEQRRQILQEQLAEMSHHDMLKMSVEDIADALQQKHAQIAQIEMQLERLATDQSLRQQHQLVANWESELLADLQDYFALQMAAQWTRESFDVANNDRLPRIEQQADAYMQTLTRGQYQHISWTDKSFTVTDYQGQVWDVKKLSRGTAQQLYVALRLAMIAELQEQVNMPLLIDDAFVDFDVEREAALVSLLRSKSMDQQILYFTKASMNEPEQVIL